MEIVAVESAFGPKKSEDADQLLASDEGEKEGSFRVQSLHCSDIGRHRTRFDQSRGCVGLQQNRRAAFANFNKRVTLWGQSGAGQAYVIEDLFNRRIDVGCCPSEESVGDPIL